jgi:hypothetical protein
MKTLMLLSGCEPASWAGARGGSGVFAANCILAAETSPKHFTTDNFASRVMYERRS